MSTTTVQNGELPNDRETPSPSVPADDGESAGSGALFTQQQVNDIAARESAKALERLFREAGCELSGRAREQQKEFVTGYRELKRRLEEAENALSDCRRQLDETRSQKQRLDAARLCTDCGVRSSAVSDVLRLLDVTADSPDFAGEVKKLLKKYPCFADSRYGQAVPAPRFPDGDTAVPDSRMTSIARRMGLV